MERFLKAQEYVYDIALAEIKNGRKSSHWMWYIFPQLKGLGLSQMSLKYGIVNLNEAKEYINHPILGPRLVEISKAVLDSKVTTANELFGYVDAMKLKSSMYLFSIAAPNISVFQDVLDKYFNGETDELTRRMLSAAIDDTNENNC